MVQVAEVVCQISKNWECHSLDPVAGHPAMAWTSSSSGAWQHKQEGDGVR